jgi:phosphatase NudJ
MQKRWKPSVTVAGVIERNGRYLLVEEHTSEGLRLNNPAGHLEPGESPEQGVVREVMEETAHPFEPTALVGIYLSRQHTASGDATYLRFAYTGGIGEPVPGQALDRGIVRTLWATLDELRAQPERLRSELVLRCIEDHAAGRRHAIEIVSTEPSVRAGNVTE